MAQPTILPKQGNIPKMPTKEDLLTILKTSGLKDKLLFTLMMLALMRLAAHIPVWGVDVEHFANGAASHLFNVFDLFSGGALGKLSIAGLGISPYISASIIIQLLTSVFPHLMHLQKEEGQEGRRILGQYTRYLTIGIALIQSIGLSVYILKSGSVLPGVNPILFSIANCSCLVGGAILALWIAEMITANGIGNGGSLLVFLGIVSRLPLVVKQLGETINGINPAQSFMLLLLLGVFFSTIAFVVILQESSRKVFITSARRQVGNKVYGGQSTHIPFKLNPGSVMPVIFAFMLLGIPTALIDFVIKSNVHLGSFQPVIMFLNRSLGNGGWLYVVLEVLLIFFFSFFYASITPDLQPKEIAENLKKHNSAIPGIKPGRPTADHLETILTRIIFIGASALAIIAFVPNALESVIGQNAGVMAFRGIGATSLLIMVGVALDFMNQIKVNLLARQYEGFLKP